MNGSLKNLIVNGEIGYEDLFEALADMVIQETRSVVTDIIADVGIVEYTKRSGDLSVKDLTEQAVDWALVFVPEMLFDVMEGEKNPTESYLEFVIRATIEKRVKRLGAFKIKVT